MMLRKCEIVETPEQKKNQRAAAGRGGARGGVTTGTRAECADGARPGSAGKRSTAKAKASPEAAASEQASGTPETGDRAVNLRIPADIVRRIDDVRKKRLIKTSRHTWLMEAIVAKLKHEEREFEVPDPNSDPVGYDDWTSKNVFGKR